MNKRDNSNLKNGYWVEMKNDSSKNILIVNYKHGIKEGKVKEFFRTQGYLIGQGQYINGKMEGEWKVFSADGFVYMILKYKNDSILETRRFQRANF